MNHVGKAVLIVFALSATVSGCSHNTVVSRASTAPLPAKIENAVVPLVDHHQHLFSPAATALVNGPPLMPTVATPPDLTRLLHRREQRWNERSALAELYADDAVHFTGDRAGWISGREAIAAHLVGIGFTGPYLLAPVAYKVEGNSASVSGYLLENDATRARFGFFQLDLRRRRSGEWEIVAETPVYSVPPIQEPITAEKLITLLNEAGVGRAVVLSEAFWFDSPDVPNQNREAAVRAENDWTADQVELYPNRLVAFCSFNPLASYALAELDRCARSGRFRGVKLSFAMSKVDLKDRTHLAAVRRVFEAANEHRLAIVAHVRGGDDFGPEHVTAFLEHLASAAPGVSVQVAHLWGGEAFSGAVLAAWADAVAKGAPGTQNLYFDVAEVARMAPKSRETARAIAQHMRQIGLSKILYGSDAAFNGRATPQQGWAEFQAQVPLTDEEVRLIAKNVAPYMSR